MSKVHFAYKGPRVVKVLADERIVEWCLAESERKAYIITVALNNLAEMKDDS